MSEHGQGLDILQKKIGYSFKSQKLLSIALTHKSFVKGDGKGGHHNERLEYLGDAVLELCISEQLFKRFPNWDEGLMTRVRASIVCEPSLYEVAKAISLQDHLLLGHGEDLTGGRDKPSILSDALEAVVGAIFLDSGIESARAFIMSFAEKMLRLAEKGEFSKDFKSALQECAQKMHLGNVWYELISATGPDHQKQFHMRVMIKGKVYGEGIGASKQDAGQRAAEQALIQIKSAIK